MKTRTTFATLALWNLALLGAVAADNRAKTDPSTPAQKLPPSLAADKAAKQANRAHVKGDRDRFSIGTPPPAPRAETRPPTPAADRVWVPGHWAAEDGAWKWIAGQWSVPATPTSVWIEGKYDPKTKRWNPGYWQPDRPGGYDAEPPAAKEATPSLPRIP